MGLKKNLNIQKKYTEVRHDMSMHSCWEGLSWKESNCKIFSVNKSTVVNHS